MAATAAIRPAWCGPSPPCRVIDVVHSSGAAGARAVTHNGIPVDLRIVPPENFGNLLQHFTGSGKHNEALRTEAVRARAARDRVRDRRRRRRDRAHTQPRRRSTSGWVCSTSPPELRENRGELRAAARRASCPT